MMSSGNDHKLRVGLGNAPHKVSALSSLFRSLQAAVRETAVAGAPIDSMFSNQEGPFLLAEVESKTNENIIFALWFADRYNNPLEKISIKVFSRAMRELMQCVNRGSQHTFWGSPATAMRTDHTDDRMARFISNLRVIGTATVSFKDVTIQLQNEIFSRL